MWRKRDTVIQRKIISFEKTNILEREFVGMERKNDKQERNNREGMGGEGRGRKTKKQQQRRKKKKIYLIHRRQIRRDSYQRLFFLTDRTKKCIKIYQSYK